MLPLENTLEEAEALRFTYGWLELWDENGQELELASMEHACSDGLLCQDETGQWMVEWNWPLAGSITFPSEIHITARADIDGEQTPTKEQERAFEVFAEKMSFRIK